MNEPFPSGKRVYTTFCENCHMEDGSGLPPLYPAIKNSPYLSQSLMELPCLIRKGKTSSIMENVAMPRLMLSTTDISNLINYMTHKWSNKNRLTIQQIDENLTSCGEKNY